jgi:asparagine synthetase B (glutamine-hydrolysing)
MCGIIGFVSGRKSGASAQEIKAVRDLFIAGEVRGTDSAGLLWAEKGYRKGAEAIKMYYDKDVVSPSALRTKALWGAMTDSLFILGHNRAATLGAVTQELAHPFAFGYVSGVHNGTVLAWKTALKDHITDAEMDSMAIMEALNSVDSDTSSVVEVLEKIEGGAYALAWADNRTKTINLARNADRPLALAYTKTGGLFFASELRMLEWVLERNHIKADWSGNMEVHTLIKIPYDGGEATVEDYSSKIPVYTSYQDYYQQGRSMYPDQRLWEDVWEELEDDLTPFRSPSQGNTMTIPSRLVVKDTEGLPKRHYLTPGVLTNIHQAVTNLFGIFPNKDAASTMKEYLRTYVEPAVEGGKQTAIGGLSVPVVVSGIDNQGSAQGFVYLKGERDPLPVQVYISNQHARHAIDSLLAGGEVVVLNNVEVEGIDLYSMGVTGLVCRAWYYGPSFIEATHPVDTIEIDVADLESQHPAQYSDIKINWWEGWKASGNSVH